MPVRIALSPAAGYYGYYHLAGLDFLWRKFYPQRTTVKSGSVKMSKMASEAVMWTEWYVGRQVLYVRSIGQYIGFPAASPCPFPCCCLPYLSSTGLDRYLNASFDRLCTMYVWHMCLQVRKPADGTTTAHY